MPQGIPNNRRNVLQGLGVNVLNPSENPYPVFTYTPGTQGGSSFNYGTDIVQRNREIFQQVREGHFATDVPPFMRAAHTNFYKGAAHQQMRTFTSLLEEGAHRNMVTFDIETLGDPRGEQMDVFSPTEFFFSPRRVTRGESSIQLGERISDMEMGMLISPDPDTALTMENVIQRAERGEQLSEMESINLANLLRYSGELDMDERNIVEHNIQALDAYTVRSGGTRMIDTTNPQALSKAREGLRNVMRQGVAPEDAAQRITDYLADENINDAFFAGHNIGKFDVDVMERFLGRYDMNVTNIPDSTRQFDTYRMLQSAFPEPLSLTRLPGVTTEDVMRVADQPAGDFSLESVANIVLNDQELQQFHAHRAESDVRATEMITEKLFFQEDAFRHITEDVIREPGTGIAETGRFSFDMGAIERNEMLFSVRGYRAGPEGLDFVAEPTAEGAFDVAGDRWVLPSQRPLIFRRRYITEEGLHGMELMDPEGGNLHYIHRETPEQLENFFSTHLRPASDFDTDQLRRYTEMARADTARTTLRKLLRTPGEHRFSHLERFLQAAQEESAIRAGEIDMTLNQFYEDRLPEILSFERNGERVVLGNFPEKYRQINERLMQEHAFMGRMVEDIRQEIPMPDDPDWATRTEIGRRRHRAFTEAYGIYEEEFGELTRLQQVPEYRQFQYRIPDPQGGQRHIPLDEIDRTRGRLMSAFQDISPARATSPADARAYSESVLETVEGHARAFNEGLINFRRARQAAFETGDIDTAAGQAIQFLQETQRYLPEYMEPQQMIEDLRQDPGRARQYIDTISKRLGLEGDLQRGVQNYQDFLHDIDQVREYVQRQDSPYYMAGAMSRLMHQYKEDIPGFRQPYQEVEMIGRVPEDRIDRALGRVGEYTEAGIQRAQRATQVGLDTDPLGYKNRLTEKLSILDENLRRNYEIYGIDPQTPRSITEASRELIDAFQRNLRQDERNVAMSAFFRGTPEDSPQLTLALFDANRESLVGRNLQELQDRGAAIIDVPLIDTNQYINYGDQRLIAPAGILRRTGDVASPGGDIQFRTAFDVISENLQRRTGRISSAIAQGDPQEAQRISGRSVREALDDLVGANAFGEDLDLRASDTVGDMFKKGQIVFSDVFANEQGQWYNYFGEAEQGRLPEMYPQDRMRMFQYGEEGYREQLENLFREHVGRDFDISLSGTRGKNLAKGRISALDVRDFTPLGYYNNPGRERMMQAFNVRNLTGDARSAIEQLDGTTFNPLLYPESGARAIGLEDTLQGTMRQAPGFQTRVAYVTEDRMFGELTRAIREVGTEQDRQLLENLETLPTLFEDQAIISRELADAYGATRTKQMTIEAYRNPELMEGIQDQIRRTGEYSLDYMEDIVRTAGDNVTAEYRSDHYITGFRYNEAGDLMLDLEERFEARQGLTALMTGQEKHTMRTAVSRQVLEEAFGEGVNIVASPGQQGHSAYGDVIAGTIRDAVRQINELDIAREEQSRRLQEVQRITSEIMGIDAQIRHIDVSDGIAGALIYPDTAGVDQVDVAQQDLIGRLGDIQGVELDPNVLTMETRFLENEENMHFRSLLGGHGRQGMRATPELVSRLEDMQFNEYARYLEDRITQGIDPRDQQLIVDEARALDHVYMAQQMGDPNYIPEGIDADVVQYRDIPERFNELPLRTFAGTGDRMAAQEGRYYMSDLQGTILDPNREGMFLELPEAVDVRVSTAEGDDVQRRMRHIYMGAADISAIERVDRGDQFVAGKLGKPQRNIVETIREYHMATNQVEGWQEQLDARYYPEDAGLEDVRHRLQRQVQEYYDTALEDVTASGGRGAENITKQRVGGSMYTLLQGRTPFEHAVPESPYTEEIARAKQSLADDLAANDVMISIQDARNLFADLPGQDFERTIQQMTEGEGIYGVSVRYPTTFGLSATPVRIMASDNVEQGVQMQSAIMTTMMQKGDYDTDHAALFGIPAQGTLEAQRRGIDYDALERGYLDVQQELDRTFGGEGTLRQRFTEELQEDITTPRGYNILRQQETIQKQMAGAEGVADNFANRLAEAKLRNPTYTGMITNLADKARAIGIENLGEEGFDEYGRPFMEAIGNLIEEPISAKHLMEGTGTISGVEPQDVADAMRNQNWNRLQELALQGDSPILTGRQWEAFEAALGGTTGDEMYNLGMDVHRSQKIYQRGIQEYGEALRQEVGTVTKQREMMDRHVFGQLSEDLVARGTDPDTEAAQRFITDRADPARNLAQVQDALGDVTASAAARTGPVGMGLGKVAGAFMGGLAVSEIGGTHDPLPMDYLDQPAMQTTARTDVRQTHMNVQDMAGFQQAIQAYSEEGVEGATNIPELVQQENMNMVVQGRTTIDRNPDQLAAIVNEEFQNELQFPININVTTQDDRQGLTSQWAEQQVLDMIR